MSAYLINDHPSRSESPSGKTALRQSAIGERYTHPHKFQGNFIHLALGRPFLPQQANHAKNNQKGCPKNSPAFTVQAASVPLSPHQHYWTNKITDQFVHNEHAYSTVNSACSRESDALLTCDSKFLKVDAPAREARQNNRGLWRLCVQTLTCFGALCFSL